MTDPGNEIDIDTDDTDTDDDLDVGNDDDGTDDSTTDDSKSRRTRVDDDDDDVQFETKDNGKLVRALRMVRAERKTANRENAELKRKIAEYEQGNLSEKERLENERDTYKDSASKHQTTALSLQAAMQAAPEGATIAQVQAVAKRVRGEDREEMVEDAEELYELIIGAGTGKTKKTDDDDSDSKGRSPMKRGKPRENLSGGLDPTGNENLEMNPDKLVANIPRHPG